MIKRLLICSTDLMMVQFLMPHVIYLRQNGYRVEVACSDVGGRMNGIGEKLGEVALHKAGLSRNPFCLGNLRGYLDLKHIVRTGGYDIIWTNEPVMGVMTRLTACKSRKNGTKILYMTHGYHFFKGGQRRYFIYYPIEKFMSRLCDEIVTINYEDYELTKRKFHAKLVEHIDGIGLDVKNYQDEVCFANKRMTLGIQENAFVMVSVGELKPHKNHAIIIEALSTVERSNIIYLVCGSGELLGHLEAYAKVLGVTDKVKFLGYRTDVNEILRCGNVFMFPSKREGLGLAALEAMAAGLPVIASDVRGIVDFMEHGVTGYQCRVDCASDYAAAILKLYDNPQLCQTIAEENRQRAQRYHIDHITRRIKEILDRL